MDAAADAARDSLARYFSEVQRQGLLDAEQEVAIARAIEDLEIAHWAALLSYPPAHEAIRFAIEQHLPDPLPELEGLSKLRAPRGKRTAERVHAVAGALRAADLERSALAAADEVARELGEGPDPERVRWGKDVARARRAQHRAKERFVAANLRLVITMARKYDNGLLPLPDLIQEGNLGLMRAVERFDWRRGYRFSTYAAWWIRHGLTRALADKGRIVRVPVHTLEDAQRAARTARATAAKTGREPTMEELAMETGLSEEKLAFLRDHGPGRPAVSLDRPVGEDGDATLLDLLASPVERDAEETVDAAGWPEALERLLDVLTPIEVSILRLRFGLDDQEELTLREIGEKYDLSRERIRQLQEQALTKLRLELERREAAHAA